MRGDESFLSDLRQALLSLSDKAFERFIGAALTEVTGRPFFVADSGRQDGADGGTPSTFSTLFECKRYDETALPVDALLGKFVLATQRTPPPDLWILAATRSVSEQRVRVLQREADEKGVGLLILDMPAAGWGDLAVLCALSPGASDIFVPAASKSLEALRASDGLTSAAPRVTSTINGATGPFQHLRRAMSKWLLDAYADGEQLRARLLVRPADGEASEAWTGYVERVPVRAAIESWLVSGAGDGLVLCVVGEEGVGKSLSCHRVLADVLGTHLVIPVTRNVEFTPDPLDLMASALREPLGGEASQWRRKLEQIFQRAEVGEAPVLLYLDGVDERAAGAWDTLLQRLSDKAFKGRVAVLMSCRPYALQERLRDLAFLRSSQRVEVQLFSDAELQAALAGRGMRTQEFSAQMRQLMRRPRLFSLALRHRERLEAAGEFTPARLFWEDWEDRVAAGRDLASGPRFRAGLRHVAASLDALTFAVPAHEAAEAFTSPLAGMVQDASLTLSELVDGGLARLDASQLVLDLPFAAFTVGVDLAERLGRLSGEPETLAERVRTWLEPWGGAEFEAEVLRASGWARSQTATGDDPALSALIAVWIECKNLPDDHEADVLAICGRSPAALLAAADIVWRGQDHSAAERIEAALQVHGADPTFRAKLVAYARRWVSQVGLMDYPFIGGNDDPAAYRARRLAELEQTLGLDLVIDRAVELDGEQITIHGGGGPNGETGFRRALTVLRPHGLHDLWPAIRAWALTTDLRHHDDLGLLVAGVLRSADWGSPIHQLSNAQLALWAEAEAPALMAAARALSWALGAPEARRLAEPALVKSGFVAKRAAQLSEMGRFSPQTLEEAREQLLAHAPEHALRMYGVWLTDMALEIPTELVERCQAALDAIDIEELLRATTTTSASLKLDEITPVLARYEPFRLGEWHRAFAKVVAAKPEEGVRLARNRVHNDLLLADSNVLRVLVGLTGDDRTARDLRLTAELALRAGDDQLAHLLEAALPDPINLDVSDELREATRAGLELVSRRLAQGELDAHRLVAVLYALTISGPDEAPAELVDQLLELLTHTSPVVRTYAMQLLRRWAPTAGAETLKQLTWTVEGAADDQEAWRGSLLIAHGGMPIDWAIGATHPAHVVQVAMRHPQAAALVAGLLEGALRRHAEVDAGGAPLHLITMSTGEELDTRQVPSSQLLDDAATSIADRWMLALKDDERRREIIAAAVGKVRAHDEKLRALSGRRPDWRVETGPVQQLWREDPAAFEALGELLKTLDNNQIAEVAYAQPGLLFSLVEAGLAISSQAFAPLWRRLRRRESSVVYKTQIGADWLDVMPFRTAPINGDSGLLLETLDSAATDAELMDVAIYASVYGHTAWLLAQIEQDAVSPSAWRRARALLLEGFLARPARELDPYPRLDARASWLSDVAFKAEGWRRRRLRLWHWLDRFAAAEKPDEIFAAFELVKLNAMRWVHWRAGQLELGDAQRRHLSRQERELEQAVSEGEKKLGDELLGLKTQVGVWPAWSVRGGASRPYRFGG